ncbi:helix-turn-helix domain-containing protein [Lentzea sp. NPDC092896]|uniref:helix-turn-helix domain-containing protein n=1 Tax=Lentzea sp. NPDC092896 TaxID=3364127 RepID=UPI003827F5EE
MSELPELHTAKEVANALKVSKWWVEDQARRRQIPFTKVGGSYRFTDAHLNEIVAIFEELPVMTPEKPTTTARRRAQPRRRQSESRNEVVPLRARPPRRQPKAG